jgi:hypothetical protein
MTDKQKSKQGARSPTPYERKSYQDDSGATRVVLIPEGETDLKLGIPLSFDLSPLFGHMPKAFQQELYNALHAQGLVEPADYFKPGAAERYQRALRTVLKHDFSNIQTLAQKELNHD